MCCIFVVSIRHNKTKNNIMNYSKFILEVLESVTSKPTKDQMQFAYIVYCGFNVTPQEALNISLDK